MVSAMECQSYWLTRNWFSPFDHSSCVFRVKFAISKEIKSSFIWDQNESDWFEKHNFLSESKNSNFWVQKQYPIPGALDTLLRVCFPSYCSLPLPLPFPFGRYYLCTHTFLNEYILKWMEANFNKVYSHSTLCAFNGIDCKFVQALNLLETHVQIRNPTNKQMRK